MSRAEINVELQKLIAAGGTIEQMLELVEGFYICPKDPLDDPNGERLGPLVAYAKDYEPGKYYVGDAYVNVAQGTEFPSFKKRVAELALERFGQVHIALPGSTGQNITLHEATDVIVGPPWGATQLVEGFGFVWDKRVCQVREEVTKVKTATERAQSEYVLGHNLDPGDRVLIVEDLVNNRTNVGKLLKIIEKAGAIPIATVCVWDRSETLTPLTLDSGDTIPHFALVRHSFPQYRQDDPFVKADVEAGNVVWKVKPEWKRLKEAMEKARSR